MMRKIMKKKSKQGDITTQQIVLLIILIVSFVVILFFIFRLNLGKTSVKEVCHNSVVTRASKVIPGEAVPLNCQTSYICITKDGTCEKMNKPEIKKAQTSDEVYDTLANEMADCWWMFGEGKINYVGAEFIAARYCSICSQIFFDDSVKEIQDNNGNKIFAKGEIDQKALYEYLAKTKIPNKDISYLDYLVGLQNSQAIEDSLKSKNSGFGKINIGKYYVVVMGISSAVDATGWAVAGGAVGTLFCPIIGTAIGAIIGYLGGPMVGTAIKGESGKAYLSPTIIEANSASYDSLKCEGIKSLA